jgi:hypothetical protein
MDADDLYPETNTLETLYNASRKYAMHTVGGNLARFYHDDRKILDTRTGLLFTGIGIMNYMEYNSYPTWGFQRFAFSRALMKKYHVRFPGISRYEDPLFFVRYMNIAKAFAFIDDIVYLYRITREFTIDAMALEAMIASTAEILDILVHISFDLYYKEYSIFISHIFTYLEQRKNSNLPEEAHIGQNIDHVLQKIDFSQYDAYIYSAKIYTSFFDILQEHAL